MTSTYLSSVALAESFAQVESPEVASLVDALDPSGLELRDYVKAVAILVVAIVAGRLCRLAIKRLIARTPTDDFLGDLVGRLVGYILVAFGLIYSLGSLGIAVAPILGALGIVGFALAFALQDILENFVAGIILQLRRPFTAGDEIVSIDYEGRILEIDARTVTLCTPDGETVRLPSSEVIKHAIVNHTQHGRRRTTIEVGVAYDTDLAVATDAALQAVIGLDGVLSVPEPEVLVTTFGASSIDLAVRYWHQPSIADMWKTRDLAARSITEAFRRLDIEIPFPQRVLHGVPSLSDGDQAVA